MADPVDQRNAKADGDVVGRDKTEIHFHGSARDIVDDLLAKLRAEIENSQEARKLIAELQRFYGGRDDGGRQSLKEKLDASGRGDEYLDAIAMKELFAKLLEHWSLYASAQAIFAFLLARAEYEFNQFIRPQFDTLDRVEVNQLVDAKIVGPTVKECGAFFAMNHSTAMGMIYWLAEQCFVRWTK